MTVKHKSKQEILDIVQDVCNSLEVKEDLSKSVKLGQIVFFRMREHEYWPAMVVKKHFGPERVPCIDLNVFTSGYSHPVGLEREIKMGPGIRQYQLEPTYDS